MVRPRWCYNSDRVLWLATSRWDARAMGSVHTDPGQRGDEIPRSTKRSNPCSSPAWLLSGVNFSCALQPWNFNEGTEGQNDSSHTYKERLIVKGFKRRKRLLMQLYLKQKNVAKCKTLIWKYSGLQADFTYGFVPCQPWYENKSFISQLPALRI